MAQNSNNNVTLGGVFSNSTGVAPGNLGSTYVVSISDEINASLNSDSFYRIQVTNASGVIQNIDVPISGGSGGGGTGGDPVTSFTLNGTMLNLLLDSGTSFSVDLASIIPQFTDTNDFLTSASLSGTTATFNISNQDPVTLDLSGLIQASPVVTNGNTYTNTRNNVTLTITNDQVTLTGVTPPPEDIDPPSNPPSQSALADQNITFDAPDVPSGGSLTDTVINSIDAVDYNDSDVSITIPTPESDGSFNINVPAGVEEVDIDITYMGTNSDGDSENIEADLEYDSFAPYAIFSTVPTQDTISAIPANTFTNEEAASGTSIFFDGSMLGVRRIWFAANTSGFTFRDNATQAMIVTTEQSTPVVVSGITYYIYQVGLGNNVTVNATVI